MSRRSPSREEQRALLDHFLRLPSQSPAVAEWLFGNKDRNFHDSAETISPEHFEQALSLVKKTGVGTVWDGSADSSDCSMRTEQNALPPIRTRFAKNTTVMYLSLIPAGLVGSNIMLGYMFVIGLPFDQRLLPLQGILGTCFANVARIAFDEAQSQFLSCMNSISQNDTLLHSIDYFADRREQHFLSIPPLQYSFTRLPTRVLGVTISNEFAIWAVPTSQPSSSSSPSCTSHFTPTAQAAAAPIADPTNENTSSVHSRHQAFQRNTIVEGNSQLSNEGSGGWTRDGVGLLAKSRTIVSTRDISGSLTVSSKSEEDSAGFSPMRLLSKEVIKLANLHTGRFYSPMVTKSVSQPFSDSKCMNSSSHILSEVLLGTATEGELLHLHAARSYYSETMGVSADMRLLDWDEDDDL